MSKRPIVELQVYDGRQLAGLLRERGKRVEAFTITGNQRRHVGTYRTRREAVRAIYRANNEQITKSNKPASVTSPRGFEGLKGAPGLIAD